LTTVLQLALLLSSITLLIIAMSFDVVDQVEDPVVNSQLKSETEVTIAQTKE
jgi:hypothetical protein